MGQWLRHLATGGLAGVTFALLLLGIGTAAAQAMPQIIHPDAIGSGDAGQAGGAAAKRSSNGYFYFNAAVNGAALRFVLDTGATTVAIRAEDAAKAGIDVGRLAYSGVAQTPNGPTRVAPITLESLTVGGITRRDVRAIVGQPGRMSDNLLGQSFTARLAGMKVQGDLIVLQGE